MNKTIYCNNIFFKAAPEKGSVNNDNNGFKPEDNSKKIKKNPLIGSIIGTGFATAIATTDVKGTQSFLKKIKNTNFASNKNLFIIALGSILGGFLGGIIADKGKEKFKKIKEANFQLLSNIAFPILFLNIFKSANKTITQNAPKTIKNIGNFVSVFSGVAVGAVVGSKIANKINGSINQKEKNHDRKLGVKDFLVHLDDLPVALAFAGIPYIDKLIPIILVSRGYDVGKQG